MRKFCDAVHAYNDHRKKQKEELARKAIEADMPLVEKMLKLVRQRNQAKQAHH